MKIYCIHPAVSSLETLRSFLGMELPSDAKWDASAPDVLIASEWIYYKRRYFKEFVRLYERSGVRLAYLGEALEADFNIFDYAVGFSNRHGGDSRFVRLLPPLEMYWRFFPQGLDGDIPEKKGFCNFLYSNSEAHPMRDELFRSISTYKKVDSLGKHLNNTGRGATGYGGGHAAESVLLRRDYKFSIAAENAEFHGYTSEKIFCALAASTVPIYWGNPDICEDVNPRAFISVRDFADSKALIDRIRQIDNDDSLWMEMVSQPWRTPEQEAAHNARSLAYKAFFGQLFGGQLERTAPEGFHVGRYRQRLLQGKFSFDRTLI